jgi:MFS family permease
MSPELARIILAQICLHACMAGTRMVAPLLALREGYSPAAVGVLLALFALTQVFLSLPSGRYADRHGLKRPVGFSVIAAVIGAGAAVAFPVFPVLCLAALLTGGATGTSVIALQRHVGRATNGTLELRKVFGWLSIGPALSNFIGPFSAGLLIDHFGPSPGSLPGYRAAFLVLALLPLLSWWLLRSVEELPPVIAAPGPVPKAWDLMMSTDFRRLMLVSWLLSSCWDVHTLMVPVLGFERGMPASVIGTILGAFSIAAAVVRVMLPLIANRTPEWTLLCAAMLVTALIFGLYPLMSSAWTMGICSVLLGFALGIVQPMVMSLLHQLTPDTRHGEALGLRMMVVNASSVVMPVLFGTAGAVIGIAGVFWFAGAAVGSGARAAWRLRESLPLVSHSK